MPSLFLRVKKKYFDQIKSGEKTEEYRLANSYWNGRIIGKHFEKVVIVHGFPSNKGYNETNYMEFPWKGYEIRTIQHDEFGKEPVNVFAIKLERL